MELKRLSFKHKNNKLFYYAKNYLLLALPKNYYKNKLRQRLAEFQLLPEEEKKHILDRVDYYNQLDETENLETDAQKLSDLKLEKGSKTYFFDLYEYSKYFPQHLKGHFLFGDITEVPPKPGFVKSRPVENNINSVLLKWNKVRHFIFVKKDSKTFSEKKDMLVGRGKIHPNQKIRIKFFSKYKNHPLCNIGKVNSNELNNDWIENRMTIDEQLAYKFILSIEGNDVASNLKWVMSSNSLAVMPKPKFETWFMEGRLIPDYHYVALNEDFSNLEEKLNYFIKNPLEAEAIIKNANKFISQFRNKKREDLISLMVLQKYFEKTGQLDRNV
jgi:uncharacterized protein YfbU (UPF0304 family)